MTRRKPTRVRTRSLTRTRASAVRTGWYLGTGLWIVLCCGMIVIGLAWGIILGLAEGAGNLRRAWVNRDRNNSAQAKVLAKLSAEARTTDRTFSSGIEGQNNKNITPLHRAR